MRKRCALGFHFLIIFSSRIKLASHSLSRFQQQQPRVSAIYLPTGIAQLAERAAGVCRQFQRVVCGSLAVNDSLSVNSSGSECKCPSTAFTCHRVPNRESIFPGSRSNSTRRPDDHYSCIWVIEGCLFTPRTSFVAQPDFRRTPRC
jgi:hypothetical protein